MNNALYHANGVWPEVKTFPEYCWGYTPIDEVAFPHPAYRILVTGWRDWPEADADFISYVINNSVLAALRESPLGTPVVIVHGACPYGGADLWAHLYATRNEEFGIAPEPHPAEINARGTILGPARNARMVRAGAQVCLGFPGPASRGTTDCMNKARAAGIPTFEHPWSEVHGL